MARNTSFTLRGFVGRDAEIKQIANGRMLAQFNLCVSERWQTPDGRLVEKAHWFRITCWGRQAEIAQQRITKGMLVEAHGRLEARQWERDGQTHYATDLIATELVFIDKATGQALAEQPTIEAEESQEAVPEEVPAETPKPRRRRKAAA